MAPHVGINPRELFSSGWAAIFVEGGDSQIRQALEPLLQRRRGQAGERFRTLEYRQGESKTAFLSRYGAGPGPADPERVPYYLLLIGSPSVITFTFQSQLDIQYAVGRLWFDDIESYYNYARSVVAAETRRAPRPQSIAVFGVENAGDPATERLSTELVQPLADALSSLRDSWDVETILGEAAKKSRLQSLLRGEAFGEPPPSFLLTAGHGMALSLGDLAQRRVQGALVCSDWKGRDDDYAGITKQDYFSAEDVESEADLDGLVVFAFGCFTAGTPLQDNFDLGPSPRQLTDEAFIAALPQRLLGKPSGAIAFIGNIDRAWTFSWDMGGPEGPQIGTYLSAIAGILDGGPIGHSMEYFNQRYAELAVQMTELLKNRNSTSRADEEEIQRLWYATADAQNFVLLGDPAITLRTSSQGETRASDPGTSKLVASTSTTGTSQQPGRTEDPIPLGRTSGALNDKVLDRAPDYLSYSPYSKVLADLIASRHTVPPLTIGVFGDWGVGKSFLLKSIKSELEQGTAAEGTNERLAPVRIVEFNAWEYSAHTEIWPGMVRKIMACMEASLPGGRWRLWRARIERNFRRQFEKVRSHVVFLLATVVTGLAILGVITRGNLSLAFQVASIVLAGGALKFAGDLIGNPLGHWVIDVFRNNDYGRQIGLMEETSADLRFLGAALRNPEERFLIVVDDLDRCEPARAVEMLKAIKLLLDFDRFIVLLGIDARVVGGAVDKHYEGILGKAGIAGNEYLEKIIQIPFQIPAATDEEVEFFIYQVMERPSDPTISSNAGAKKPGVRDDETSQKPRVPSMPGKAEQFPLVTEATHTAQTISAVQEMRVQDSYETVDLSFSYKEMRVFQRLTAHVDHNPRNIKRILNVYRLVRAIAFRKQDLLTLRHPEETILWVTLCLQWPIELNKILQKLEILQREPDRSVPAGLSRDPLLVLFEEVRAEMQPASALPNDFRRLQWLLTDPQIPRPDHLGMLRLQRYAIHIRPWEEDRPQPWGASPVG